MKKSDIEKLPLWHACLILVLFVIVAIATFVFLFYFSSNDVDVKNLKQSYHENYRTSCC